ncbi:uncharacterized protein AB675_169 [Cyphellophora attinorum]|uniref:Uncharacterized protein n=1 Tax=Cyphellophora attinorum TaxID=1664694 RepID=A0A0N1H185_9EURO|nr:uncharacterized protein AB675_169 [Phialophora attinorum]KPI37784.1 hypothetical protein AB675_169 [Phialophora attinorum]
MSRLTLKFREYVSEDPNGEEKRSFDIFETYLQPKSDLSTVDASVKLRGVFTSSGKRFGDKFHHEILAHFIEDLARQVPAENPSQDRLVSLFKALQAGDSGAARWSAGEFEEGLNAKLQMDSSVDEDHDEESRDPEFINWIAFVARLCEAGIINCTGIAIEAQADGLEIAFEDGSLIYGLGTDMRIQRAAMWVIHSPKLLWKGIVHTPESSQEKPEGMHYWPIRNGAFYHGASTGLERWRFWKSRFEEAMVLEELTPQTKAAAARAALAMERQEGKGMIVGALVKPDCNTM